MQQVPANTLQVQDDCQYGTISFVEHDDDRVKLTTDSGEFEVNGTDLVWLTITG
jgi:hypothetical protein